MKTCVSCGTAGIRDDARFCPSCGTGLAAPTCGGCGADLDPGARFCALCGTPVPGAAAVVAPAAPVASRRVTSVLFGDLVGFTSLSETRDTEDVRELLSRYFDECRQVVERYGGVVEKFIGDAVMAVWGVPTAHEDDAERAVRAGLELVSAVHDLGSDLGVDGLAMRVGIVTGEVAVTVGAQQQGMVAGDAVNTASRVQSVAQPGQVWVDETTRLLTSSAITYSDAGSHSLKGKAEPVPLWSVRAVVAAVGGAQRADGLEAPHLGRDRELRLVKELFHRVEESRRPTMVVVGGEPGIGKTRLGWEFFKYIDGLSRTVRWHAGRCLAYGEGVAFYALSEAVRGRLQAAPADTDDTDDTDGTAGAAGRAGGAGGAGTAVARGAGAGGSEPAMALDVDEDPATALTEGLARYVADAEERAWLQPRLESLLGIGSPGTFAREDLFSAWTTFLERVAGDEHPVVLLIDDAQHADEGLLTFLEYLLATAEFGCFVMLLARPGLLDERPALAGNRRATVLHLEGLPEATMGQILDGLVAGLPGSVRDSLVERAEGVPLFAVETVRSLIDKDLVVPRGGQYVLADADNLDLDAVAAPASLQALLAARLDSLSTDQRRVVDQASIVGNSFEPELVRVLCPDVDDVAGVLDALVRAQILRRESSRLSAERGQYQFVQSAVRQVAYGTLSRRDRKAGHLAVVRQLEHDGEVSAELASIVAQHYLEAVDAVPEDPDVATLNERAVVELRRAADRAMALASPGEAAGHLERALARVTDETDRAQLLLQLARALTEKGDYERSESHAREAIEQFERLGDVVSAGRAAETLYRALAWRGDLSAALEVTRDWFDRLHGRDDALEVTMDLASRSGLALARNPDTAEEGLRYINAAVLLAERMGDPSAIADAVYGLATYYGAMGGLQLSAMLLESATTSAREAGDLRRLTNCHVNLNAFWNAEDAEKAAENGRAAIGPARQSGVAFMRTLAHINLQLALVVRGSWTGLELDPPSEVVGEEAFFTAYMGCLRAVVQAARGEQVALAWPLGEEPPDDPAAGAVMRAAEGLWLVRTGEVERATATALDAAETMLSQGGTADDFFLTYLVAVDLALDADDRVALGRLADMSTAETRTRAPRGVRAIRTRLDAVLADRDGAPDDQVERLYRRALAEHEAWHAEVLAARCRGELGTWLARRGRVAEAQPLLDAARSGLSAVGARAWLEALGLEAALTPEGVR